MLKEIRTYRYKDGRCLSRKVYSESDILDDQAQLWLELSPDEREEYENKFSLFVESDWRQGVWVSVAVLNELADYTEERNTINENLSGEK